MGNSDAHSVPQVIGLPQTVMQLESLSRDAIVSAIAEGRTYIAESSQVALTLSARGGGRTAGIGERLAVSPSTPVIATAEVSGVPNGVVRFITDEGQLLQSQLSSTGVGSVTWTTTGQQSTCPVRCAYYRVHLCPRGGAASIT